MLLLVAWPIARGRARATAGRADTPRWPAVLILLAICLIAIAIGEIPKLRSAPLVWLLFAAVAALHGAAFVLLLQMREARSPGELALGVLLIAGPVGIAVYVMCSGRIRSVPG